MTCRVITSWQERITLHLRIERIDQLVGYGVGEANIDRLVETVGCYGVIAAPKIGVRLTEWLAVGDKNGGVTYTLYLLQDDTNDRSRRIA